MKIAIEEANFKKVSLEEISKALQKGLSKNFKEVTVSVIQCPNLKEWDCPAEGMSGNQKITDVGGEPYMHDKKYIGAEFDFKEIAKLTITLRQRSLSQLLLWLEKIKSAYRKII
jgi:hypothetical protein